MDSMELDDKTLQAIREKMRAKMGEKLNGRKVPGADGAMITIEIMRPVGKDEPEEMEMGEECKCGEPGCPKCSKAKEGDIASRLKKLGM